MVLTKNGHPEEMTIIKNSIFLIDISEEANRNGTFRIKGNLPE